MKHSFQRPVKGGRQGLLRLAILSALLLAVYSCTDHAPPTAIKASAAPNKNIVLTDWYSCWKYVDDSQWRVCEYTGTTADENGASFASFTNPTYYTSLQQVGVTQNRGAVEPAPQPHPPTFSDDDTTSNRTVPDCNRNDLDAKDQAWCLGKDPFAATGDHHRLPAINRALDRMRALGPPCDSLANEMAQVVGSGHLHFYHPVYDPNSSAYQGGGFATRGQHGNGYVLLSDVWVDTNYDENKFGIMWTVVNGVRTRVKWNLQFGLAHEADHLHDDHNTPHVDPKPAGIEMLTPNSVRCGGLGS
jgi:hypothetical protein